LNSAEKETTVEKSISINEAAEALSVHHATIRRRITSGDLKAFKIGRIWRIIEKDIDKFISERRNN
jgi:excisionase family DNA binding protein